MLHPQKGHTTMQGVADNWQVTWNMKIWSVWKRESILVQNIDGPFCQCGFFERKSAGRIYRPADEASAAEFAERCETLFRFSGGEWTDLYAGLHSGTEPGDLFPETGRRADDDLLLYRRPVPA